MIKTAGLDSGKQKDQSCLVSLQVHSREVFVEGCKFWPRGTDYQNIEDDVARLHLTHQWRRIMVEVNNVGEHVYEQLLRKYGLPVRPVTTVAKLSGDRIKKSTSQRLRRSMPKNEMVTFYLKLKKLHRVKFPAEPDRNMRQLEKQLTAFTEKKTEAGNITYAAPGSEHDDGVMALLMALFEAKPMLEESLGVHVGGGIPRAAAAPQIAIAETIRGSDWDF